MHIFKRIIKKKKKKIIIIIIIIIMFLKDVFSKPSKTSMVFVRHEEKAKRFFFKDDEPLLQGGNINQ